MTATWSTTTQIFRATEGDHRRHQQLRQHQSSQAQGQGPQRMGRLHFKRQHMSSTASDKLGIDQEHWSTKQRIKQYKSQMGTEATTHMENQHRIYNIHVYSKSNWKKWAG